MENTNWTARIEIETLPQTTVDIQKLIREYYEHLFANKFESVDEIDNFPGKYKSPRQIQKLWPELCYNNHKKSNQYFEIFP